jgi:DoxX-like family
MLRFSVIFLQLLLTITFLVVPVSRIFGAPTLQQVLSLGVPTWLIWVANVVELSGAVLLLLGLRFDLLGVIGALLIASSMVGATLLHMRSGNLFAEVPWTIVIFGFCLIVVLLHWQTIQLALKNLLRS